MSTLKEKYLVTFTSYKILIQEVREWSFGTKIKP